MEIPNPLIKIEWWEEEEAKMLELSVNREQKVELLKTKGLTEEEAKACVQLAKEEEGSEWEELRFSEQMETIVDEMIIKKIMNAAQEHSDLLLEGWKGRDVVYDAGEIKVRLIYERKQKQL
jgi:hypothetical protein